MDIDMLKENGKKALSNNYWLAVGASAVVSIIMGAAESVGSVIQRGANSFSGALEDARYATPGLVILLILLTLLATSISLCANIFLNNILTAGHNMFYLKLRKGISDFGSIFFGFQNGNYSKVLKVMLKKYIFVFLWTLLFIIPGIIKGFEYFMVDYLAAENPDITPDRALEISSKTMDGHKMDLFVLKLSFIGWWCLVILTCGIGAYFLTPYIKASETEFYEFMKAKAINEHIATPEEFGISAEPMAI